jgi:hypothetical protein
MHMNYKSGEDNARFAPEAKLPDMTIERVFPRWTFGKCRVLRKPTHTYAVGAVDHSSTFRLLDADAFGLP